MPERELIGPIDRDEIPTDPARLRAKINAWAEAKVIPGPVQNEFLACLVVLAESRPHTTTERQDRNAALRAGFEALVEQSKHPFPRYPAASFAECLGSALGGGGNASHRFAQELYPRGRPDYLQP